MGKEWVGSTDFADRIRETLNPTSAATGGIRPIDVRDPAHRNVGD